MSTYPDDLCLSDAEANGLDPEALREQVLELLGTGVELDPARLRAGVRLDLDAERSAFVRASGSHRALPAPRSSHWSTCLLYTSPSPRDGLLSRMPSSA